MDKEKGLCYKVQPNLELFKKNLGAAWGEIIQLGDNMTGKTCPEKRLQRLERFANLSEPHKVVYNNYMEKYTTLAKKMDIEIVQDKIR